jgi:hypothetical protein
VLLCACATLTRVQPAPEVLVRGLSSSKNPELAKDVARSRATVRAGLIKSSGRFVLDRSRGKPMLKLLSEPTSTGLSPDFEALRPVGQQAVIRLKRTPAELEALSQLQVVRVKTEASGLDLAVAQDRADRALFRDAILLFASAQLQNDPQLYGTLTIVNYGADATNERVVVRADIAVTFGSRSAVLARQAQKTTVNEDQEEVPEEKIDPPREEPASQSAP